MAALHKLLIWTPNFGSLSNVMRRIFMHSSVSILWPGTVILKPDKGSPYDSIAYVLELIWIADMSSSRNHSLVVTASFRKTLFQNSQNSIKRCLWQTAIGCSAPIHRRNQCWTCFIITSPKRVIMSALAGDKGGVSIFSWYVIAWIVDNFYHQCSYNLSDIIHFQVFSLSTHEIVPSLPSISHAATAWSVRSRKWL